MGKPSRRLLLALVAVAATVGAAACAPSSGKLLRILQRQADGSWKMHRTMTVAEPAASE